MGGSELRGHVLLKVDFFLLTPSLRGIKEKEVNIILHCRKMFLFHQEECWVRKADLDIDVSMGALDSAEICELVVLLLLSKLERLIPTPDWAVQGRRAVWQLNSLDRRLKCKKKKGVKLVPDTTSV